MANKWEYRSHLEGFDSLLVHLNLNISFSISIVMKVIERVIVIPSFWIISEECTKQLKKKYNNFNNSWVGIDSLEWWIKRVYGKGVDLQETANPKKINKKQLKEDIIDQINILSMFYEKIEWLKKWIKLQL